MQLLKYNSDMWDEISDFLTSEMTTEGDAAKSWPICWVIKKNASNEKKYTNK
jgi:hypothetical protein